MVSLQDYQGREQAYVKHVFLESYLERLAHKVASSYTHSFTSMASPAPGKARVKNWRTPRSGSL
jgi:hypothetical protein